MQIEKRKKKKKEKEEHEKAFDKIIGIPHILSFVLDILRPYTISYLKYNIFYNIFYSIH